MNRAWVRADFLQAEMEHKKKVEVSLIKPKKNLMSRVLIWRCSIRFVYTPIQILKTSEVEAAGGAWPHSMKNKQIAPSSVVVYDQIKSYGIVNVLIYVEFGDEQFMHFEFNHTSDLVISGMAQSTWYKIINFRKHNNWWFLDFCFLN